MSPLKDTTKSLKFPQIGGDIALDLANTVSGRSGSLEIEHLQSDADVVAWAQQLLVGTIPELWSPPEVAPVSETGA